MKHTDMEEEFIVLHKRIYHDKDGSITKLDRDRLDELRRIGIAGYWDLKWLKKEAERRWYEATVIRQAAQADIDKHSR